jgi:hypothetical protein
LVFGLIGLEALRIAFGKIASNCNTAKVERYLNEAWPAVSLIDMYFT